MRIATALTLTCGLLLAAAPARGDDAARKVIDKALKAHGIKGPGQPAVTWKGKGKFYGGGGEFDYAGTWSIQFPDKFRMEIPDAFVIVVNGSKGWTRMGGDTTDMAAEQVAEQIENLHVNWVSRLHPLTDKAFTLTLAGETKVGDKPAVGVKVAHRGRRDVTLYFDKESGLLAKIEHRVKDEMSGTEMTQESFVKGFETQNGTKFPSKMLIKRDGKDYVDGEMTEYKTADKLPAETFAKP
jgi:hypothetical protein